MNTFIILPTQLFKNNPYLELMDNIYIIEDPFYFTSKPFHKQKLLFHRATMKYYYDKIKLKYNNVKYIEFEHVNYNEICKGNIYIYDPIDKPILKKLINYKVTIYDTPLFLETRKELEEYRENNTNKKNGKEKD